MLRAIKRQTFKVLRRSGVFRRVAASQWRRSRLLILCYHGVAQDDEHLWRPALYMQLSVLERRLEIIRRERYDILPLGEALERLRRRDLPPRSLVFTFDDGMVDFATRAYPLLRAYGAPVTVYQTTYYVDLQRPIFNLMCSYLLWKRRAELINRGRELGLTQPLDLRSEASRKAVTSELFRIAEQDNFSGAQKDALAADLAALLGIDYQQLLSKRLFHTMNQEEIAQLAKQGVDFQLHTHRHRSPTNEQQFRREIQQNRFTLEAITGRRPMHFCYPSGLYKQEFVGWLRTENLLSATTCDPALATAGTEPLLLPRFIDTAARSEAEFEGWLSGVGAMLALRS